MVKMVELRIKRQKDRFSEPYWEDFRLPYQPNMNVIVLLNEIRRNPVNAVGHKTTPVSWDCSCLEEVCGACTMVINGQVRQSCTALVDQLEQPIILEPMRKFPVIRDLVVNRGRMFKELQKIHAWIDIDGTHELGSGPRVSPNFQEQMYIFSRCMTCGCCVDACPQSLAHPGALSYRQEPGTSRSKVSLHIPMGGYHRRRLPFHQEAHARRSFGENYHNKYCD